MARFILPEAVGSNKQLQNLPGSLAAKREEGNSRGQFSQMKRNLARGSQRRKEPATDSKFQLLHSKLVQKAKTIVELKLKKSPRIDNCGLLAVRP
jgi:hypothetical protein